MTVVLAEGLRLRSGRYELKRRLGSGGAASVWLADDTLLERPVAIKVLAEGLVEDREWLARFRREARIAARLSHPNLVSIYDFEAEVERPYLVMAYMSGGSLQDRLEGGGAPDPERLAVDLLRALDHIHAADIVHRDVKPGNVLLARDGRACLTDFGVARPQDATSITQTGQIPGTARYMAPELWRGEPANERSDLFACGVLLSQCLRDDSTGRLIGLTERMSAENPELRPASAQDALDLLDAEPTAEPTAVERAVAPAIAADPEASPEWTPRRDLSRAPRWIPVAALCAVAAVAGIVFASAIGGDDDRPGSEQPAARDDGRSGDGKADRDQPATTAASGGETTTPDPGLDGVALNDQGKTLIDQGRYEEAIPYLEQAVAALEGTGGLDYAYALFNLGQAYRLAGRPADAIPILEQRLEIPNQVDVVKAELDQAKADLKAQEKASEKAAKKEDD